MKISILLLTFIISAHASYQSASRAFNKSSNSRAKAHSIINELEKAKLHNSALSYLKEHIIKYRSVSSKLYPTIEKIIRKVGTSQIEGLPLSKLNSISTPIINYVVAKKLLKKNRYSEALKKLKSINSNHHLYPFAANLMAVIYNSKNDLDNSLRSFNDCIRSSSSAQSTNNTSLENDKLKVNKDICTLGVARTQFEAKQFDKADLSYLDIPKSSPQWPEILFEEAWNSYYQKNYNRTLGKLVSYKAPVFDYIFNPEIEVLTALSYLKMCLYKDAQSISDSFYEKYLKETRRLRTNLKSQGKKYSYFYRLISDFEQTKTSNNWLYEKMLKNISRDLVFRKMKTTLKSAIDELRLVKTYRASRFRSNVYRNIQESINSQMKMIGGYVRSRMINMYAQLYKSFEGMSYIKLEVLAQRKARLYNPQTKDDGKRGDIELIEKNEKQYFWNFNGEFWADELGDYVFALRSEC